MGVEGILLCVCGTLVRASKFELAILPHVFVYVDQPVLAIGCQVLICVIYGDPSSSLNPERLKPVPLLRMRS
jgi:hypothetical protein